MRGCVLVLLACFGLTGAAFASYPWLEPARLLYDRHGIDISHHQRPIDWSEVAKSDVSFAYMKATEGRVFVYKRFRFNWLEAKAAGIPRSRLLQMQTPFDLLTLLAGT